MRLDPSEIDHKTIVRFHMDAGFNAACYLIGIALSTYTLPRRVACIMRNCTK